MPKFSSGYGAKSNIVDNDKFLIADSEASGEIKGTTKASLEKGLTGGTAADVIYKTTSGTYSKPAKLKYIIVEVVGGGGGGGGVAASPAGQASVSGGGGGGGYSRKRILAANLASTETVTIGLGGARGAAGPNAGQNGTASSFGSHCSASGGLSGAGGGPNAAGSSGVGGNGGTGSSGDLNLDGNDGGFARNVGGSIASLGTGGGTRYSAQTAPNGLNQSGATGKVYGGGGSGTASSSGTGAQAGGAGAPGIVIINEYY